METALLCMIAAAVVAVFILVGKLNAARRELSRVKYEAEDGLKNVEQLRGLNNRNEEAIASLQKENSALSVENARLSERLSFIEVEKDKMKKETEMQFRLLANEIFATESKQFRESSENRLDEILKPLKENIHDFKQTIINNYTEEAKERHSLKGHIKELMDLNYSIGKEARELTEALRGNSKVQGDWGEMILESILEKSGLIKDENYFVQPAKNVNGETLVSESGNGLRPDVVVCMPDKKYVVIDSKVSLTAYTGFVNAETEEERARYGKAHVQSVRAHLKELQCKSYQDYVGVSPQNRMDFVLMFIPNEQAYMVAMSLDKNLWQEAYDKRVVIISPAHVISTLRLIAQLWTRDRQTKNALTIAEESGKLYDKFVGLVEDLKNVGTNLERTKAVYDQAFNKLSEGRGNLISRVEKIKELGAKTTKSLPDAGGNN